MLVPSSLLASSNVNKIFANFEFPYINIGRNFKLIGFKWSFLVGFINESEWVFEATTTILHGVDFFNKSNSKCVRRNGPEIKVFDWKILKKSSKYKTNHNDL